MPSSSPWSLDRNPWVYLFLFLAANTLLSYAPLPLETKLVLGMLGIGLPLYVALRTASKPAPREKPGYLLENISSPPGWLWALGLLALVIVRFYKLETLFRWPTLDEGWNGILAIQLSQHWTWRFFYTFGQAPPLPVWTAALLFKLGVPPALALWLPSALVSLATVLMGYFAARRFFSKSFSLVCGGLLAFSYWPLFIGRFCHQGIWLPLWVECVFFAWGGFLKAKGDAVQRKWSAGLGLAVGCGSFTFTPWMAVAGFFFLTMAWLIPGKTRNGWKNFLFFSGALLASLMPFLFAVGREGYGQHILSLSPWGGWFHHFEFFWNFFRYFAVLLWGSLDPEPAYTPLWGGFLNPLLGAFYLVGIVEIFRLRLVKRVQWLAAAFLFFLVPGALSPNLETFRVAQVMPLLLLVAALGVHSLLGKIPSKSRLLFFGLLMVFTAILDFNLLAAPYQDPDTHPENFGRPLKSLEKYRAFERLIRLQKQMKPTDDLFILSDFDDQSFNDPTLYVMTFPMNSATGIDRYMGYPKWLAVFVDSNYLPFLQKKFPNDEWTFLSKSPRMGSQGNLLGLIRFTPQNLNVLGRWNQAHLIFQKADLQKYSQNKSDISVVIKTLENAYPLVKGDPFLESVFWDKRAAYEYETLNYDEQLRSYKMAVTLGFPTADLYYKLGQLLLVCGHTAEARQAFLKATHAPLDLTPARALLAGLKEKP